MGDIYHYPVEVLRVIRGLFAKEMPVVIDGPAKVQMFAYDNNKVIIRSNMIYDETLTLLLDKDIKAVKEIVTGRELPIVDHKITIARTSPSINYVLDLIK